MCLYFHSTAHGTFCAFTAREYNILGEHSITSAKLDESEQDVYIIRCTTIVLELD